MFSNVPECALRKKQEGLVNFKTLSYGRQGNLKVTALKLHDHQFLLVSNARTSVISFRGGWLVEISHTTNG